MAAPTESNAQITLPTFLRESAPATVRALLADDRVRYVMVGGFTSVLYYALFALAWSVLEIRPYLLVTVMAHISTAILVYPLYRTFVFRSNAPWVRGFVKFYTVFLGGLVVSFVGLPLLVEVIGMPVLISQGILIFVVPIFSYLAHRAWTFRPHAKPADPVTDAPADS